ncbi:ankyrin repeat domain-containing protein [Hyphomicrobium album]|uniref:ankyrin repeat domain-containing protein n=1 Tax=Hyphomicrobium album TaxID=2665159 RepID=UPI001AEE4172|nr:ankyrin repeat domain-containing protein [Hyphomicrobium album]
MAGSGAVLLEEIPDGARAVREAESGEWSNVKLTELPDQPRGFVRTIFLTPADDQAQNPFPNLGPNVFVLHVKRLREDKRGGARRTVGTYAAYYNGSKLAGAEGHMVEPRGPGDNTRTGQAADLRIKAGTYRLQVQGRAHGTTNTNYRTFGYERDTSYPRPGVRVRDADTWVREAILFHPAGGFKSTTGCLNVTSGIADASDDINLQASVNRTIGLIDLMRAHLGEARMPKANSALIEDAYLVVDGEPPASGRRKLSPSWYTGPVVATEKLSPLGGGASLRHDAPERIAPTQIEPDEVYDLVVDASLEAANFGDGGLSVLETMVEQNYDRLTRIVGANQRTLWHLWIVFWEAAQELPNSEEREARSRRLLAIAGRLKAAGVDINGAASDVPPIVLAAQMDAAKAITVLHELGADLNRVDHYGRSALHVAAMHGAVNAFAALLKLGADKTRNVAATKADAADNLVDELPAGATVADAIGTGEETLTSMSARGNFTRMRELLQAR